MTTDHQPTVLIVEDSSNLSDSLKDMLELKGFCATVAATGAEAVETALTTHPDVILLDIKLPDIDGYEVYRRIRKDAWGEHARILVLTASESTEQIARHIDLPPAYVLFKPEWGLPQLLEKIQATVEQ